MKRVWSLLLFSAFIFMSGFIVQPQGVESELHKLRPEWPTAYLELGEELLIRNNPSEQLLARELLCRAVYYGYQSNSVAVASSACIALRSMDGMDDSEWLWDLAQLLDPSRTGQWLNHSKYKITDRSSEVDRLASACLYSIRYHQYPESSEMFRRQDVRSRIIEAAGILGIAEDDLIEVIEREIERGADDPCRGRLYVIDRDTGDRVVCPNHVRALGLCANDEDFHILLRVEMVILGVRVNSWDSAASIHQNQPVRLPSVRELMARLQADPSKAYYRDGSWRREP